ncbi:hypothetical protein [Nocardioides sp. CER19]|uniref:hypothetical protein n=1 Tax=Nocardioides sp. CER19 TaxID=3038538 RepID=UPI00244B564E|nr:hypothetical protein [Nocardioides sp. CER19]MDH2415034.1 hypothetical protein [Nocardioides sp. CER19]
MSARGGTLGAITLTRGEQAAERAVEHRRLAVADEEGGVADEAAVGERPPE